nr:hypothetical protein [uncultured Undibacterium sp.]
MILTTKQTIAECKKIAKQHGFIFDVSDEVNNGSPLYMFKHKNGEVYRVANLGLAYEIACSDELVEASRKKQRGFQKQMEEGKRVNVYLDANSLEIAAKLGNGNVSEGIRFALLKNK